MDPNIKKKETLSVSISKMTILFSISSPKMRKSGIFGAKFKNFYFTQNFTVRQIQRY